MQCHWGRWLFETPRERRRRSRLRPILLSPPSPFSRLCRLTPPFASGRPVRGFLGWGFQISRGERGCASFRSGRAFMIEVMGTTRGVEVASGRTRLMVRLLWLVVQQPGLLKVSMHLRICMNGLITYSGISSVAKKL